MLAVGVLPNRDAARLFTDEELALDAYDYVDEVDEDINPGRTSIPGVFVAGAASGAEGHPRVDPSCRRRRRAGRGPP